MFVHSVERLVQEVFSNAQRKDWEHEETADSLMLCPLSTQLFTIEDFFCSTVDIFFVNFKLKIQAVK